MPANMDDFLGEGTNDLADAPEETEEQRRKRVAMELKYQSDAALADVPYGTAPEDGGSATHFQVTNRTGPGGLKDALRGVNNTSNEVSIVNPADGTATPLTTYNYRGTPDAMALQPGSQLTPEGAHSLDAALGDGVGPDPINVAAQERSDEGVEDRGNALQDVIDRMEAAGKLDTTAQDESRDIQKEALSQNRQLFAKAQSYDPEKAAAAFSEESLSHALAIARSAPGGASRESALMNALESAPAAQAEGQRQANAEGRAQQSIALQASNQLGQLATGVRGQDEGQSEAATSVGLDVAKTIATAVGHNLDLDQRDREFLGEVALQVANLNLDVKKLGVDETLRQAELALQKAGLDQEWKQFKASQKITGKDILGGIFGLGGSAIGGLFTGLAAKKAAS